MKYFEIAFTNLRTRCCESAASETVYVKACEERWRSVYSVILVIAMRRALDAFLVSVSTLLTGTSRLCRGGVVDDPGYEVLVEVAIGIEGGFVRGFEVKSKRVAPVERVNLRQHRRRVRTCACTMRQRSHASSLGRSICSCDSSPHELRMLTILVGHSRAEWPVAPHVLHTRYGHVLLCWRCPGCAHIVQ